VYGKNLKNQFFNSRKLAVQKHLALQFLKIDNANSSCTSFFKYLASLSFEKMLFIKANKTMKHSLKSTLAVVALSLASTGAFAAGAVSVETEANWNGTGEMDNRIGHSGGTISASNLQESENGYTGNAGLGNASWGHAGAWYTFMTHHALETTISVVADSAGDMSPGFTLWKTDGEFDGGTGGTGETPNVLSGPQKTPHSFNQIGAAGDNGTIWMTDVSLTDDNHGILETIGYVNAGPETGATAWDNNAGSGNSAIMSDGDIFVGSGWYGSIAGTSATLSLDSLDAGWYALFISGTDGSLDGSPMTLTVSQVPVPAAVYLFGTALLGVFASGRRKLAA